MKFKLDENLANVARRSFRRPDTMCLQSPNSTSKLRRTRN